MNNSEFIVKAPFLHKKQGKDIGFSPLSGNPLENHLSFFTMYGIDLNFLYHHFMNFPNFLTRVGLRKKRLLLRDLSFDILSDGRSRGGATHPSYRYPLFDQFH